MKKYIFKPSKRISIPYFVSKTVFKPNLTSELIVRGIEKNRKLLSKKKILDMGCGSGYLVNELTKLCGAEGISNSIENINTCKKLFTKSKYTVGNMESYQCEAKSHCIAMESFNYSNPELTFKNAHTILKSGGILFLKELCGVEEDNPNTLIKKGTLQNIFHYTPYKLSFLLELAKNAGFELISNKDLTGMINPTSYERSVKYHHDYVKRFDSHTISFYDFMNPIQLKFRKI